MSLTFGRGEIPLVAVVGVTCKLHLVLWSSHLSSLKISLWENKQTSGQTPSRSTFSEESSLAKWMSNVLLTCFCMCGASGHVTSYLPIAGTVVDGHQGLSTQWWSWMPRLWGPLLLRDPLQFSLGPWGTQFPCVAPGRHCRSLGSGEAIYWREEVPLFTLC